MASPFGRMCIDLGALSPKAGVFDLQKGDQMKSASLTRRNMVWLAILLLAAIPVAAKLPTGAILGTVRDSSGGSIPHATVAVRNTDTNLTRPEKTEKDGSYRFPELPVGHYELKAEAAGFKTETRTALSLEVTQQGGINFEIQVGAA